MTFERAFAQTAPESRLTTVEEPTPLIHHVPPGDPFPVEAMGPLRAAAEAIHEITEAPVAIGAQSLLAAASLACQAFADVQTLGGVKPISLFALTIAKSGERKSSCDALAMEPVRTFERELAEATKSEQAQFRTDLAIWEATNAKLIREAPNTKDNTKRTAAMADLADLGAAPMQPLFPFLTSTEPTLEGITKNLDLFRPSIGIFSDEGGQFLGGHAMNSENRMKTVSGLSKFWDGDPINRTRAGDGVVTFYGRRLCVHLMVQPVISDTLLGDPTARDQGFLARFLICSPPSSIGIRFGNTHSPSSDVALAAYSQQLGSLLRRSMPLADGCRNELELPVLNMTVEATAILLSYANVLERKQAPGEELSEATAFASKSAEQAARIAGVLAVFADETSINAQTMTNAITLAAWYLAEAVRLRDGATISAEIRKAEKLRVWLLEKWPEDYIAPSPIVQAGAANIKTAKEARGLITQLVSNGWLIRMEDGATVKNSHRQEAYRVIRGSK
jgi:hypothetical protein